MSVMPRKLFVSGMAAVGVFCLGAAAVACEDIAVVSEDARYIVLSGDDFAEKDVGNLWWLAIRSAGLTPIIGSTFATAALNTRFFDRETGALIAPAPFRATGIIVHELGRNLRVASDLVVAGDNVFEFAWWLDNRRNDRLVDWNLIDAEAQITLMDADLNQLGQWTIPDTSVARLRVGCEDAEGRIVIAGLTTRLVIDGETVKAEPLERADRSAGYRMLSGFSLGGSSLGCVALLVQFDEARANVPQTLQIARIDLAENRIESEFATARSARRLLFAEGQRLLEQVTFEEQIQGGIRSHPTTHVRVLNTDNGAVLQEGELPAVGELALAPGQLPRLFCRAEAERVVLSAQDMLYLIDLGTLSVIASRRVPFERYFVM